MVNSWVISQMRKKISKAAAAAPAAKTDETAPTTFELTNIKVEEVSLVDRAANRKKFAVVKHQRSMRPATEAETSSLEEIQATG